MRSPSLTRSSKKENGRLVSVYDWRGNDIKVCDSARNALLIIELFADEQLTDEEKSTFLHNMVFAEPGEAVSISGKEYGELLSHIVWDAFGIDITENHEHEEKLFDWDKDAARIKASLLQSYNVDWETASNDMPYTDMCALLGSLLESESQTPFQQAVYYRTVDPPKRTKDNGAACDAFDAKVQYFALDTHEDDDGSARNAAMADTFAAAFRAAEGV